MTNSCSITAQNAYEHSKLFKNLLCEWFWTGLGDFIDARERGCRFGMSVEFLRDSRLHTRDSRDSSLQRVRPKKQHVLEGFRDSW